MDPERRSNQYWGTLGQLDPYTHFFLIESILSELPCEREVWLQRKSVLCPGLTDCHSRRPPRGLLTLKCWRKECEVLQPLQRALPLASSLPLLLSVCPSSHFLHLSQISPDSSRTKGTLAGNFYTTNLPFLSFPFLFFNLRHSSFIISTFKAAK